MFPYVSMGAKNEGKNWSQFLMSMHQLANTFASGSLSVEGVPGVGLSLLKDLDVNAADFRNAVNEAYESGNRFWLWQRLVNSAYLNGGILNIDNTNAIPLHDHPGATGMLRIIEGEAEVWQYDAKAIPGKQKSMLKLAFHKVLKPGDVAMLTPGKGNIHSVKSVSKECRMLDFFIPPYNRKARSWYVPEQGNWQGRNEIICKKVSEFEFDQS
jgi:hypothetical protein